jgi:hypothetical protein
MGSHRMTDDTPQDAQPPEADPGTWTFQVRHRCVKCDRLAVVYDDHELPLCGRHATIFMTATRTLATGPTLVEPDTPSKGDAEG